MNPAGEPSRPNDAGIVLAVVGAPGAGLPLDRDLAAVGARPLGPAATAAAYWLYALDTIPPQPGLLRAPPSVGVAIEVELWVMPVESFGRFVAALPAPFSIGTVDLADGRDVKGVLVEAVAVVGAQDITAAGGWRAFLEQAPSP